MFLLDLVYSRPVLLSTASNVPLSKATRISTVLLQNKFTKSRQRKIFTARSQKFQGKKDKARTNLNHVYSGRPKEVYVLCKYIRTINHYNSSPFPSTHHFAVIFSSFKSLTTMYRLRPIQPQRNHLIWLLCAVVIAFCADLNSAGPLMNSSGFGCSPIFLGRKNRNAVVSIESRKLVYFRINGTVLKVYRSTGQPHPGRLCMREAMKWRAPWKREMWLGCEETPDLSNVMRTSIVAVGASTDLFFMGFARLGAKNWERRVATFCLSHVVVMLSGNSLIC